MIKAQTQPIKPNFPLLDPKDESTWRNIPPPVDTARLQQEITETFGRIPEGFGEMSGKPLFKIVWGQTHRHFSLGKQRLMFDDERIKPRHLLNQFAVRSDAYDRAVKWLQEQERFRQQAFLDADWQKFARLPDVKDYLEASESVFDYIVLPSGADPRQLARLIPPGFRYLAGLYDYEEIGVQCYLILQWTPPDALDSEKNWNDLRFDWVFLPEAGEVVFSDILGEYPRGGGYFHELHRVCTRLGDENYRYEEPVRENTVEIIARQKRISERRREMAKQLQITPAEERAATRAQDKQRKERAAKEDFYDRFDAAKPLNRLFFDLGETAKRRNNTENKTL